MKDNEKPSWVKIRKLSNFTMHPVEVTCGDPCFVSMGSPMYQPEELCIEFDSWDETVEVADLWNSMLDKIESLYDIKETC